MVDSHSPREQELRNRLRAILPREVDPSPHALMDAVTPLFVFLCDAFFDPASPEPLSFETIALIHRMCYRFFRSLTCDVVYEYGNTEYTAMTDVCAYLLYRGMRMYPPHYQEDIVREFDNSHSSFSVALTDASRRSFQRGEDVYLQDTQDIQEMYGDGSMADTFERIGILITLFRYWDDTRDDESEYLVRLVRGFVEIQERSPTLFAPCLARVIFPHVSPRVWEELAPVTSANRSSLESMCMRMLLEQLQKKHQQRNAEHYAVLTQMLEEANVLPPDSSPLPYFKTYGGWDYRQAKERFQLYASSSL